MGCGPSHRGAVARHSPISEEGDPRQESSLSWRTNQLGLGRVADRGARSDCLHNYSCRCNRPPSLDSATQLARRARFIRNAGRLGCAGINGLRRPHLPEFLKAPGFALICLAGTTGSDPGSNAWSRDWACIRCSSAASASR